MRRSARRLRQEARVRHGVCVSLGGTAGVLYGRYVRRSSMRKRSHDHGSVGNSIGGLLRRRFNLTTVPLTRWRRRSGESVKPQPR